MTFTLPPNPDARLAALKRNGLMLTFDALTEGAGLVHTSFAFGPEIWALPPGADPDDAQIDMKALTVTGARLLVDARGVPLSPEAVARAGFTPVLKIPRL